MVVIMLMMGALLGLVVGMRATISRHTGAGDADSANHALGQALIIGVAYGLVMTAVGILVAEPILNLYGVSAEVAAEGVAYMRVFSLSWIPLSLWWIILYCMQAAGDTVNPMRVEFFIRFFHVALCPFLVFGWWVFPRMGVIGVATSNIIIESMGLVFGLWILLTGRTRLQLILRGFRPDLRVIWGMVKIGVPGVVMSVQSSFSSTLLMWIMVPFGTLAVAAHTLGGRVQMVIHLPNRGLGLAAGVLVGQNLGAVQPERAERSGWLAAGLVEGFMLICSVVILLWAESIIRIFSSEPELVEIAGTFLRIAAAGYLVMGFSGALQQSISGAGDTVPPMVVSLVNMWLVMLPLAYFLPQITNLGVYGVRWAMVASTILGAVAFTTYFKLGRWKHKKI
jgi:putative MATE family efflux protein